MSFLKRYRIYDGLTAFALGLAFAAVDQLPPSPLLVGVVVLLAFALLARCWEASE